MNWKHLAIIIPCLFALCHIVTCSPIVELDAKGVPVVDYGFVSPYGDSSDTEKEGWTYIGKPLMA